jgi:biopolymer transport protein ExbB
VEHLDTTLKVEVNAGPHARVFPLKPAYQAPGRSEAVSYRTIARTSSVRLFGPLTDVPVDLSVAYHSLRHLSLEDKSPMKLSAQVTRKALIGGFGCPSARTAAEFPRHPGRRCRVPVVVASCVWHSRRVGGHAEIRSVAYPSKEPNVWKSLVTLVPAEIVTVIVKGGVIMIPLLAASLVAVTVIIERWSFWRSLRRREVDRTILGLVAEGDVKKALEVAGASPHPIARVLHAGIQSRHTSPGTAMQAAAQAELRQLRRYLPVLDTIITLAPLLGLLGTITGMISAFGIVSEAGLGQPHAITGGIAEALIATATGLLIAIVTLIPYNYFRAKVEELTDLTEERATRLELLLGKQED